MALVAKNKKCEIAWHGHNHKAGKFEIDNIEVWDCGCWTEKPCSYLTLKDGMTKLHYYAKK